MLKLIIDNSFSKLQGLTSEEYKTLRLCLSYTTENYHNKFLTQRHYLIDRYGNFPTGLLYLVEDHKILKSKNPTNLTKIDLRKAPKRHFSDLNLRLRVKPYPEQLEAANRCLERFRGIIEAPTGLGKSVIIGLVINKMKVSTLVVVPTLALKEQLTDSLIDWFGEEYVRPFSSNKPTNSPVISVENIDSLDLDADYTAYDCVIIDEFHHSAAKTYRNLNKKCWKHIYYRFGLTATPYRSNENERLLLESVLSETIYRVPYAQAVRKGYIVPLEAFFIELPKQPTNAYTWSQVYSELIVENKFRNELISQILNNLKDESSLCLVKEIRHGEILANLTNRSFISGLEPNSKIYLEKFNSKEILTMIGTYGILGEGVDTKPAEYIIIAGLGKSKNQFMQQIGRGFRTYKNKNSCKVILFKDRSHKFLIRHFNAQVKYLLELGIKPVKLEL